MEAVLIINTPMDLFWLLYASVHICLKVLIWVNGVLFLLCWYVSFDIYMFMFLLIISMWYPEITNHRHP